MTLKEVYAASQRGSTEAYLQFLVDSINKGAEARTEIMKMAPGRLQHWGAGIWDSSVGDSDRYRLGPVTTCGTCGQSLCQQTQEQTNPTRSDKDSP